MAQILKGDHLFGHLFLGQFLTGNVFILLVIWAVNTSIYTIVGEIKRSKNDDTIAIECLLNFLCKGVHFLDFLRVFTG